MRLFKSLRDLDIFLRWTGNKHSALRISKYIPDFEVKPEYAVFLTIINSYLSKYNIILLEHFL